VLGFEKLVNFYSFMVLDWIIGYPVKYIPTSIRLCKLCPEREVLPMGLSQGVLCN